MRNTLNVHKPVHQPILAIFPFAKLSVVGYTNKDADAGIQQCNKE